MTEWVDSDVLNWVGMLRFRQPFIIPLLVVLYAISYYYHIPLLTSFLGIMMMCAVCLKTAQYLPNLFSSFREYIFPIYLLSLPIQNFVELILWKQLFYDENLFFLFYGLNLFSGLYIPVLISKVIERCPIKTIRLCFGLSNTTKRHMPSAIETFS